MASLTVVRPGALTTVQDLGRPGFGAAGVPRGGAADPWPARLANRLVGNDDGAALLEITLTGPTLQVDVAATVVLVGDDFEAELDGVAVTLGEPIALRTASLLRVGRARRGARAWLAVAGGIDVPLVLGSRSTDLAGAFGGHEGRALRAGDRLQLFPSMEDRVRPRPRERVLADSSPGGETVLRILPGPDESLLARSAGDPLVDTIFRVSPHSDRRGVRLAGARVPLAPHAPLRSQGTLPGAVQIPPSGEPIVLGVDAPVTGGYPWVAQVVAADVGRLARLAPGATVRFARAGFDEAERAWAERWRELDAAAPR
jgi:biotin-dependent carboxylase-like uncharacterized protein